MKIYIIGISCSGKTTLAKRISEKLNITHIELDQIWWQPGWQELGKDKFRTIVTEKLFENHSWVVDGNYNHVRELLIAEADQIIWLNLPFRIVFCRAIARTLGRIISKETVCNGNHENWQALFSKEGMPFWVIRTYSKRIKYGNHLKASDKRLIELKTPAEINRFLNKIAKPV